MPVIVEAAGRSGSASPPEIPPADASRARRAAVGLARNQENQGGTTMSVAAVEISRRAALTLGAAALAAGSLRCPAIGMGNAGVLRYVPAFNPPSLDPPWGTTLANQEAAFMVFDTLYGLDASLAPQPQMVEGHELSADQRVWRFTLREGLRFHDGEPVRAVDAIASIGRWAQRAPLGARMK